MEFAQFKKVTRTTVFPIIKVLSPVLILSAIGLELSHIYASVTHHSFPQSLMVFLWIGRFAVASHFVEGMIAAYHAPSKKKMPILYGAYTFFVGTVGLLELFDPEDQP